MTIHYLSEKLIQVSTCKKPLKNANTASVTQEQLVAVQLPDQYKKLLCFIWIPSQVLKRVLMIPVHSCLIWQELENL